MTVNNRPEYLDEVFRHLKLANGVKACQLHICLEPGNADVREVIAKHSDVCNMIVHENAQRHGCSHNTWQALEIGFQLTDYVIHLEDDILPGVDFLDYLLWARDEYRADQSIYTVTANSQHFATPEEFHLVGRRPWFSPHLWATWRDRWDDMRLRWDHGVVYGGWDIHINQDLRGERFELYPLLSRSQDIGEYGTYANPGVFQNSRSPIWSGDPSVDLGTPNWKQV